MYKVVLFGIADGHALEEVKKQLAGLLKLDPGKLGFMDKGRPVVIKKGVDKAMALRFKTAMENAGARCSIQEMKNDGKEPGPDKSRMKKDSSHVPARIMCCPNCGFEQPEKDECGQCGIVIGKFLEKKEAYESIKKAVSDVLQKYKHRLTKRYYFAPDIPESLLRPALAKYAEDDINIEPAEALVLLDTTLLARDASSNTIFTPTSMISRSGVLLEQIEYIRMKAVVDKGLLISRILQLDKSLISRSGILTSVRDPRIIISLLKDLHQVAKRAEESGTLPKGKTEQRFSEKPNRKQKRSHVKTSGKLRFRDLGFSQVLGGFLAGGFVAAMAAACLAGLSQRFSGSETLAAKVGVISGLVIFPFVTYKASFFGVKQKASGRKRRGRKM